MKSIYEKDAFCPCSGRHCSIEDLNCHRGKMHFGQSTGTVNGNKDHREHNETAISDAAVILMLQCGRRLHHGLRERAENEDILSFLSPDERDTLSTLLKKCIENWNNYGK